MSYTVKQIPSPNHWNGRERHTPLWLILHGTDANTHDDDGAYETAGWFQTNSVSTNYVVGRHGLVAQCVQESDAPYANGGVTNSPTRHHDPWWSSHLNPNLVTISLEHVKHAGNNNADALTPAQQQTAFALIYDICKRNKIPMRQADAQGGITGHFSMDPLQREHCPGNYPWNALWTYLNIRQEQEQPEVSEVAHFNQADQFLPGRSAYECGFYATYVAKSMGQQAPALSPQQISAQAQSAYTRYNGSNSSANMDGMSLPQLYSLLKEVGLHYQGTKPDLAHIQAWLRAGYPLIVAVAEPCIHDLDLNDNVPYPWTPTGNHIIVLTGLDGDNFYARDTANIIAPNTLRPGPRRYDAHAMARGLVSATAVVPSWLPIPTKDIDPNSPPLTVGINDLAGWHDDGTTLTASNGIKVVKGFRVKILSSTWDAGNVPYEPEHPMNGEYTALQMGTEGSGQLFRDCYLRWTPQHGVYFDRLGNALSVYIQLNKELQTKIDTLTRELATKSVATPLTPEVLQTIAQVENSIKPLADLYSALLTLKGK
ncbi:MAG: N-acetylmuramoyl-L-alanine amidase [Ktedonobacteraceae bacterium]|nr:N-acetylmuramoyl-L-alanine amidase [Ktedonobacteraceae bacterium]